MELGTIGIIGILILFVLLALGFQISVSMGFSGIIGFALLVGFKPALNLAATQIFSVCSTYEYIVIPLFMFMGLVIYRSGFAAALFKAMERWIGKLRGGLMLATIFAAALFGAANGSSIAAAVTFTKIAVPEMLKLKYDPILSLGSIAAAGTLSALIPPSALMIIYAIVTEESIGKCLMAGILPGVLTLLAYSLLVWFVALWKPHLIPKSKAYTMQEKLTSLKDVWVIPLIGFIVLGGLYIGLFTPTEASAVGAFLTLLLPVFDKSKRGKTFKIIKEAALDTLNSSAMIFAILAGAFVFSSFLAVSRLPVSLAEIVANSGLDRIYILIVILFIWLVMGTFMSSTAMLVITLPIIYPMITNLGYDGIWFGVISVKMAEFGVLTPPVGLNVYAVKGAMGSEYSVETIFKGVMPFLGVDFVVMALLIYFPEICLLIPNAMR